MPTLPADAAHWTSLYFHCARDEVEPQTGSSNIHLAVVVIP
ncbi:MAG TPA: hypothetical protein VM925_28620 [Labilithrix sp.]|nr:hypothetical protein [Labilithrix sp.]